LVDYELAKAVVPCVLVCFGDNPGGGVGHAEIIYFAGCDEVVEGLHHFWDGAGEIPVVHIELGNHVSHQKMRLSLGIKGKY
jgi:hypothetical protein